MRRIASFKIYFTACFLLAPFTVMPVSALPDENNYEIKIKSGVSREVIDYEDDSAEMVVRGGTSLWLADSFFFDFTGLRNIDTGTYSYTWNIAAEDISGFFDFISGNYNLHFGSGLMMGKASYRSGDPFSRKISIAKDSTVSPSGGGNPEYSLYGTAFNFHRTFDDFRFYLLPFISVQRRYISVYSYETGVISSSLFSLNAKIESGGKYTEPVNIINYGTAAGVQAFSFFNLQAYYFETDLKGDSSEDILWEGNSGYGGGGIDRIKNAGLFAEYADSSISFFVEPAMSSIVSTGSLTDYAVAYGISMRNSFLNYSLKGKNTGCHFHSEYSSGSRTPERIWETRLGVIPAGLFQAGIVIYSEKDIAPGYNSDYADGSVQEEFFAKINRGPLDIDFNVKRKEHYSADRTDPADRGYLAAGTAISERTYLKIRTSAQRFSGDISFLCGIEVKFLFLDYMTFSAGYTEIRINGEVPYYAVISPASEHSSLTSYRDTAHGGSVNLRYSKDRDSFYVRFTLVKTGPGYRGDAESALALFF